MPDIDDRDEQDEREYRLANRRMKLLERRIKIVVASIFLVTPFVYIIGAAIAKGFGANPAELPWPYLIPFLVAGMVALFNFDLRDVMILFGQFGAAVARIGEEASKKKVAGEDDE